MDNHEFDNVVRNLACIHSRRGFMAALSAATAFSLPAGHAFARKSKKATLCLDGETLEAKKKKKRKLLSRGATLGACVSPPPPPPLPPSPPPPPPLPPTCAESCPEGCGYCIVSTELPVACANTYNYQCQGEQCSSDEDCNDGFQCVTSIIDRATNSATLFCGTGAQCASVTVTQIC